MDVLWSSPNPIKPSDVQKKITNEYAYTTIMTVLKRLADKKVVTRTKKGNTFYYSAIEDRQTFACTCLDDLFTRLFRSYGETVAVSFNKIAKTNGYKL